MRYLCKSPRWNESMIAAASHEEAATVFAALCGIKEETVTVREEGSPYGMLLQVTARTTYEVREVRSRARID
jgi:hypothetical protein